MFGDRDRGEKSQQNPHTAFEVNYVTLCVTFFVTVLFGALASLAVSQFIPELMR